MNTADYLVELYQISQKLSHSVRVPLLGRWEVVSNHPLRSLEEVQKYLNTHFFENRGLGTHPHYESYSCYEARGERLIRGDVVYTFESLPAPDSYVVGHPELFPERIKPEFTHVRIKTRVLSRLGTEYNNAIPLDDLF